MSSLLKGAGIFRRAGANPPISSLLISNIKRQRKEYGSSLSRLSANEEPFKRAAFGDSSSTSVQAPKEKLAAQLVTKARKRTQPAVYEFSGVTYAMPEYMVQKRLRILMWNILAGSILAGFVAFIYNYSIWAVQQDEITEDFLDKAENESKQ